MAELDDNIINLGEYFTDKAAQMFKGVLAEQNKNISALTKAVGKIDNSQKSSPKKQDTTLSKDLKKIQDENRKLMAQNRNESLKLVIMSKDLKKQELEMRQSSLKDKKQFKFLNSIAYTPSQLKEIDKATHQSNYQKQIDKMNKSRITNILPILRQQIKDQATNPSYVPGLKPLRMNKSGWHNADLLSKGAIPIDWKPQDKFQKMQIGLLGNILNSTKGMFVLTKKQQKSWDKFSKDFGKNMAAGIASSVSTVATPLLKDAATIGYIKLAKGFISQGKTPEEQKNRRNIAVIGIATVLPMVQAMMGNQYIMGRLTEEGAKGVFKLGKMGIGSLNLGKGAMGLGRLPLLAAVATAAVGAWGAYTGFKRGYKEGGLGEGLRRGGTNFFTNIGKTGLQAGGALGLNMIPGYEKFTSAITDVGIESTIKDIGKLIKLSGQLTGVELRNYLDSMFKKIFPTGFNLFDLIKNAFVAAVTWLKDKADRLGNTANNNGTPALKKIKEYAQPAINEYNRLTDKYTTGKKENLKNTNEVIKQFQKEVKGSAYISSITGNIHNPLSGHYQGKKFDVGLLNKNKSERIREYKALTMLKGTESIGFETPDKTKYKMFKQELEKNKIDTSKLKPYYWTKESSGEHFDVKTKILPKEGNTPPTISQSIPTVQTKAPTTTMNRGSNYDPTGQKATSTCINRGYVQ